MQRMLWGPPLNVVHWGHPFETPRYTKLTLWLQGCVKPGHHAMTLVWVGLKYREVFWGITEMQNEKEPQHDLCAAPNFHLDGGSYCDSAFPNTLYEIINLCTGGVHYHNSSLHLGGNWAQHKDHVVVPFSFSFLLFPKNSSTHFSRSNKRHFMVSWLNTSSPSQFHLSITRCLERVSPMYQILW